MADGRLTGKVAVVTGSTDGIGAGIAQRFAAEGASVVVCGRRREKGDAVAGGICDAGGQAVFQQADLRKPDDCTRLIARAVDEFGALDVLVNNAGVFPRAGVEDTPLEMWDEIFELNVRGAFLCSQAAIPHLRQRGGGAILNIGSCHAFNCGRNLFAYGTSKSALYGMTMHLARALAGDHIRVNWITVGWVLTDMEIRTQSEMEGHDEQWLRETGKRAPMGERNSVEDIAGGCVYLASDDAKHVTGTDLNISAGYCVRV